jgi:CheY-like chemotaxis protein
VPAKILASPQDGEAFEARVQDISAGGAFVIADHPLPFRKTVRLTFYPGGGDIALEVESEVVHSMASGFGVEFAESTPESVRTQIVAWVSGIWEPAMASAPAPRPESKPKPEARAQAASKRPQSGTSPPAAKENGPVRGPRILLVQDNKELSRLLMNILKQMGAQVRTLTDAKAAPQTLAQEHHDLVLLDWLPLDQNPEMLIKQLRTAAPRVPIVIVTALAMNLAFTAKARACGVSGFVKKPFQLMDLIAILEKALEKANRP